MRKEYDFSKAKRNPYAKRLKRQVTIRLDHGTIAYFKALSKETGLRYQTLINLYLRDCAATQKKLAVAVSSKGRSLAGMPTVFSGALAYHDLTPAGLPLSKVFVRTTLKTGDLVSVSASHELVEMLVACR